MPSHQCYVVVDTLFLATNNLLFLYTSGLTKMTTVHVTKYVSSQVFHAQVFFMCSLFLRNAQGQNERKRSANFVGRV